METLLEALRPNDEEITRITTAAITCGENHRPKAKIIFLESPTGTGKSLSLGKVLKRLL